MMPTGSFRDFPVNEDVAWKDFGRLEWGEPHVILTLWQVLMDECAAAKDRLANRSGAEKLQGNKHFHGDYLPTKPPFPPGT